MMRGGANGVASSVHRSSSSSRFAGEGRLVLLGLLERDEEVVAVGGGVRGDLAVDLAGEHELDQRLREGLHLEELARRDRVRDLVGPVLADQVLDARVRDHHLDRRHAAAVERAAAGAG